jgi:Protein of unknown function (DUF3830)
MTRYIDIDFVGTGVVGRVELLDDEAPLTCAAVWDSLPRSGPGSHAMYSGTAGALFFDDDSIGADIGEENATSNVQTGDVMFTHYDRMMRHGHLNGLAEVYWAYDRYVRPTIPGQHLPAIANVFGTVVGEPASVAAFYDLSRRLHSEGFKPIEIRRVE